MAIRPALRIFTILLLEPPLGQAVGLETYGDYIDRSPWETWFQIFCPTVPTYLWNIPGIPQLCFSACLWPPGEWEARGELWLDLVSCFWSLSSWGTAQHGGWLGPCCPLELRDYVTWIENGQEANPVSSKDADRPCSRRHSLHCRHSCLKWIKSEGKSALLWVKNLEFWSQLCCFPFLGLAFIMCNVRELD